MGVITSGSFAKLLWPGLNSVFGKAYAEHPVEYTAIFDTFKSGQAYEEDLYVSSFGLASVKPEGSSITYDEEHQAFVTRYTHAVYALGFIVTREMFDDDLYAVVGQRRARGLAFSMRQTKETVAANILNRGFNSSFTGGDGLELFSSAHINWAGGTWRNELSTASDLSEATLEEACIDIMKYTNDRGLNISVIPQKLIIPPDEVYNAERILYSPARVGTADNDLNALRAMGKFPGGVHVNHYLTNTDACFIKTNVPDGMKLFQRRALQFAIDNDFDTENAKFKATERYVFGWSDPRAMYGIEGA